MPTCRFKYLSHVNRLIEQNISEFNENFISRLKVFAITRLRLFFTPHGIPLKINYTHRCQSVLVTLSISFHLSFSIHITAAQGHR